MVQIKTKQLSEDTPMVETITTIAEKLRYKYHSQDPFEVAQMLHIHIWERDLGSMKGFYNVVNRERYIVINQELSFEEKKVVCAHELGHDRLHRHFAQYTPFRDIFLYDMARRPEREANIFGAAFLISDTDIYENIEYSTKEIAQILHTSEDYVKLKIELLSRRHNDLFDLISQKK